MCDEREIFSNLSSKIGQLLFGRTQGDRNVINQTLDELNALNYGFLIVSSPTKSALLINQCCSFIPTDDGVLIKKCCQLFGNLIHKQGIVVEGRTLTVSVQWCLQCLKQKDSTVVVEVLLALDALLRSSLKSDINLTDHVAKSISYLVDQYKSQNDLNIILLALKCLEACTFSIETSKNKGNADFKTHLVVCAKVFFYYLNSKPRDCDELIYCKILVISLNGLQNIVGQHPDYLTNELGYILGVIKSYMLYGLKGIDFIRPQKLLPTTLSMPETPGGDLRRQKGGKLPKHRKHRDNKKEGRVSEECLPNGYVPATTTLEYNSDSGTKSLDHRLKTSDSDFSDSESGKLAKINATQGRIRQAALNLFHVVLKHTEKSTIFSYWLNFVPEVTYKGKHNLLTCILKDPSSKGRMAALNVLLQLLSSSKLYLFQAEGGEKSTSFTPFSVILGLTLVELHKSLSLALNEISSHVLIQILKCFAALVQATPYHKLKSGLITKVVRNIKPFIYHRDASIQVTALIVLGCVLASEPMVPETGLAINKLLSTEPPKETLKAVEKPKIDNIDFEFVEFSSDEEIVYEDNNDNDQMSWLLYRCLHNLGLNMDDKSAIAAPAPVKLESLQVLSAMSRNYFDQMMAPHLNSILKVLEISLTDRYMDLQLHAGRAVDFIAQAINRSLTGDESKIELDLCAAFWMTLLNGPLIGLLQNDQHAILRAVGCDCIGSIGSQIFEQLPRDKQFLCVTLLFSCTRDEENSVRGAAVRALAICVLHPSLKEDTGFVVDTAEAIHRSLKDTNLTVRVKASWSLGNLSDALVLNRAKLAGDEDLPPNLLLKLLEDSINGAQDSDKVKMNAVRALGNLLQLVDENFNKSIVEKAFSSLVKCATTGSSMKVRWNACYAIGKALKNPVLYTLNKWQSPVFNSLIDLVISFRNFKVRINAALALMSPPKREFYGDLYHPVWVALLKALENSENMEDFNEYKHRDHLVDEVCLALAHLMSLLNEEDIPQLREPLSLYYDNLKKSTHKVIGRLVPEESKPFFSGAENLKSLNPLNAGNKEIVQRLRIVCDPELYL